MRTCIHHLWSFERGKYQTSLCLRAVSYQSLCCRHKHITCSTTPNYSNYFIQGQHGRTISFFGSGGKDPWKKAISEAERIVGYPTSFMSLRCLLSDELASVALHVRKLVGTKHPLLQTAKNFLSDGSNSLQTRGLVVLLVSKAAGSSPSWGDGNQPLVSGIHPSQRALAEITEMIYTAFLVHRGVVDLNKTVPEDGPLKDMEFGNKMAVLSGDFLLASASAALASLKNTLVVDLISQSIDHMTRGAFTEMGVKESSPFSNVKTFDQWKDYVYLSSGSLIGHSCKAALLLANQKQEFVDAAFEFGKNLAWAQQLHQDLTIIQKEGKSNTEYLLLGPVILHNEISPLTVQSDREIIKTVQSSSAVSEAKNMCQHYVDCAMKLITEFPNKEAKEALYNLLRALTTFK
ncbi:Decaprenyl-diphosphate synthase subunit 2 [Holothuria leucospilota]|uniref:Decaprenyl-diphosphate synthase subunit 2 n=1 Tax=Holothuria leucospilota TaxID=206669 RepID=A0A9Q1BJ33_HOLLE|nr:Decaprenyl-diphosphate synthase subunit 2 [Holothuria leucospilota]